MDKEQYWIEAVKISFEDRGIIATNEQIESVAQDIASSHECIGMAFYVPDNPIRMEVEDLKRKLKIEESKVVCEKCRGIGVVYSAGPYHGSSSSCFTCNGAGYHVPR